MILPLRVTLELVAVKVNLPQISRGVALGLIVEMRRGDAAAFAAGGHGFGAYLVAELHHRDEAVATGAVPLLRSRIDARSERRQRSPGRRREADRNARAAIVERLHDVAGEALEAVDVAPRRCPRPEIGGEFIGRRNQSLQE